MEYNQHILSKSTFLKGSQCPKALFLFKYRPELRMELDEKTLQIMQLGTDVGKLARELFPDGVDASPETPYEYQKSVQLTQEYIAKGHTVIYEACFQYEGVLCALDILVKQNNKWHAYEVKSSTKVKDYHKTDASLQYYVITKAGLAVEDIAIVHINNQYRRVGELNVQELFTISSVLEDAKSNLSATEDKIVALKKVLENKEQEPQIKVGMHCSEPFECEFKHYCWANIVLDEKFEYLNKKDEKYCLENEIYQLCDLPENYRLHGNSLSKLSKLEQTEISINKEAIQSFLSEIKVPFYYLDFETYQMAVPEFDNVRPYQMIPFQYSLHIKNSENETAHHFEFLGNGLSDPRPALLQKLITELGATGTIVCYNQTFEKTRLKEMANDFPEYEDAICAIIERIIDLMLPFQKAWYYHPDFGTSYSIKYVLPALIPEFSYENLAIKNGGEASSIYPELKYMEQNTKQQTEANLFAYCKLDTLAMVRIHEFLQQIN
ncbi:MAG TPA: DUF2779 domain-containing protein [Chitinophagales bacterium]|nr:DUF2779 domain-containing protein [Chitinophagales bacterium]